MLRHDAGMSDPVELLIAEYARDLVVSLKQSLDTAKRTDDPFEKGMGGGYYMALQKLLIRARSRGLDLKSIGLDGIDPDTLVGLDQGAEQPAERKQPRESARRARARYLRSG
jgi:hypothetical protein